MDFPRRAFLSAGALAASTNLFAAPDAESSPPKKTYKLGVISARIQGKPQRLNGHTWNFCQYFSPDVNLDAIKKYLDPGRIELFHKYLRNPQMTFGRWPFPDIRTTHYYEADPEIAKLYGEAYPGVQVATSLESMVKEVDAVWLGDASGYGEDHFDLIAPALERGLPTFCDKPIGASVAGTRKILEFAQQHKAPLMSSSLFRHQWGTEEALRLKVSGEFGPMTYTIASQAGDHSLDRWLIYGHHPTWMVMTLCGPGAKALSMVEYNNTSHALVKYPDRAPAEIWCGRPDAREQYCATSVHFQKKRFEWTPAIEGNYWYGHHYQMLNMADAFRQMVRTGVEPVPHQEILEVTALIHAGVKSLNEKGRLVELAEVM